jgi:hypothetical protein
MVAAEKTACGWCWRSNKCPGRHEACAEDRAGAMNTNRRRNGAAVEDVVTLTWDHTNFVPPDYVVDVMLLPIEKGMRINRRKVMRTTAPCAVDNWTQFFECRPGFYLGQSWCSH